MWFKYPLIILLFFVLAIFQASFLPHFSIFGIAPDLVFIAFFTLIFFEKPHHYYEGVFFTITAGSILDLFSTSRFGAAIGTLFLLYFITKTMVYFLKESRHQFPIFYFFPIFLISFILYVMIQRGLTGFYDGRFFLNQQMLIALVYNTIIALLVFYLYPAKSPKQLKLL